MSGTNTAELLQDVLDRMKELPDIPSDEKIRGMINEAIQGLGSDSEFVRKVRFGEGDQRLIGSKFSRYGLEAGDIEFLYDFQRALATGLRRDDLQPSEELENAFRDISEAMYVPQDKVRELDKKALDKVFPRIPISNFTGRDLAYAKRGDFERTDAYQRAMRAMDTAESGYGSQLIGAQYVGELWQAARQQSRVFGLMETFEMTDPTAYLPVEADIPEMLFVPESTANNSSNYDTSKTGSNRVQVDAKKFVIHQMWSGEMEEDSIIPFIPYLRRQSLLSLAHYGDSVILNGDTTNAATGNINSDDADPADTKHFLAFDGIRHAPLVDNTALGADVAGAITYGALMAAKAAMVDTTYLMDWGHPTLATDLVYVADPFTADKIATLDEIINWKIQAGRTLMSLPGQVGEILGHPVIASIAMSKTEADGKVSATPANNTLGQFVAFNRRSLVAGWRRRVKLMVEQLPATDQVRMVHSLRLGFGRYSPTGAASGISSVYAGYNIDLT